MDTYGDMVTLLLCFFVLLYSMSTMDQAKWIALVQALNPNAQITDTGAPGGPNETGETIVTDPEQAAEDLEQIYLSVKQYTESAGLSDQVTVTKGNGYVFISFDDAVFFGPDSPVLLDSGKEVLDQISESLAASSASINELRVLGHTAQGSPDRPNNPVVDRTLASSRATNVTIYLQEKNFIDPSRLISMGFGQWRPIADNDTSEGRASNRRVELIVTGAALEDSVETYYTIRSGE